MMKQLNAARPLTIAIAKQDKIKGEIVDYLASKGFVLGEEDGLDVLKDSNGNIPNIRVEFVRAADALFLMQRKVVDLAMIGSDVATEYTTGENPAFEKPEMKLDLDVAGCTFELAVPINRVKEFKTPKDIDGLRIATANPTLLKSWLAQNNISASEIVERQGDVESSVRQGLADVVADLVSTGGTLARNNLKRTFLITSTSAVCYARPNSDVLTTMLANEFLRNLRAAPMDALPTVAAAEERAPMVA